MQSYYTLRQDGSTATVYIYGDITADEDIDGGVCASSIVRQIETIDADTIHVHHRQLRRRGVRRMGDL